jgi:hypothetical protein
VEPALVLPLVAFLALVALFLVALRRAGRLVASTRELERFRSGVTDLGRRVDTSLGEVTGRIDSVRRGRLAAREIIDDLAASSEAVERYAAEARALRPPIGGAAIRESIVGELERAGRALQMVEHGCSIYGAGRSGERELEAKTSIKRGYLNLVHARDAVARHVRDATALATSRPIGPATEEAAHHRM